MGLTFRGAPPDCGVRRKSEIDDPEITAVPIRSLVLDQGRGSRLAKGPFWRILLIRRVTFMQHTGKKRVLSQ